ncbi:probable helicase senataxin isoform X1 [Electrophorus electricus]|uniref:probable helicase senataxin isoform X1 n=1 Tax=Electrophorus electricus TaxID=8005 RepID=UPI0015CFB25D|nr:probable helicase senataxin isoform X1 [Electrophorus electricus]XP_035377281.1 probable helicase senataxin isoform X1 [Electrophorus electricus]
METCLWCSAESDEVVTVTLQRYCTDRMSPQEMQSANDDLIHCGECVVKYHGVRDGVPHLHKRLWELETSRLLKVYQKLLDVKLEEADVYVVDDGHERPVLEFSPEEFIVRLRFPIMEVLKYPYLLCNRDLCNVLVKVICKMQEMENPVPVTGKYQGIYLLMVHPNEMVRRWAIATARSLGRVDRDMYYELEEIFSCMFYIVELGISLDFPELDDYCSGKIQMLPSHLYDSKNKKNYWLGVCMLLMQLDSQAMDSLFMGPEKCTNILQCILNTMTDRQEEEDGASDPFWPALQCFMVILDRLGSQVWSRIEPTDAFQAVTLAPSYVDEIQNIRQKTTGTRVKLEHKDDEDMVSCSQMVYDCYSAEQGNGWSDWPSDRTGSSTAVIFEEMSCLVNILQSEIGQDMRVYGSTFLWFIPFVRSVMELPELGIVFLVIHYLCDKINMDVLSGHAHTCDKVTEFFVRVLVDVIELHLSKDCMSVLEPCTREWVMVIVLSAMLSGEACVNVTSDRKGRSHRVTSTSSHASVTGVGAMSQACMKLILALLKKGRRMGTDPDATRFLNLLNVHLREVPSRGWNLTKSECDDLQNCLGKLAKAIGSRSAASAVPSVLPTPPAGPPGSLISLNSTSPHSPQQPQCKDAETCTRAAFSVVKEEPQWECAETQDFCSGLETIGVKKEPRSPVLISEIKAELKPDFGKMEEIRSKLNDGQNLVKIQAIAMRRSDSGRGLNECHNLEDAGCVSGNTYPAPSGSAKQTEHSKNNWNEDSDEDASLVRRRCRKMSLGGLSSDSEHDACDSRNMSTQPFRSAMEDAHSNIIVISDDEVDASDEKLVGEGPCSEASKTKSVLDKSPGRDYDDQSESQVFEFETQENIPSAWDNLSLDGPAMTKKHKRHTTSEACTSCDAAEPLSSWASKTQPVTDEDIEKACQQVEEQISKQQQLWEPFASSTLAPAKPSDSPEMQDHFIQPKPRAPKTPTKKSAMADAKGKPCRNKKAVLIQPLSKKLNRGSHSASAQESEKPPPSMTPSSEPPVSVYPLTSSSVTCQMSSPAIVPPKKVRKHVESESAAERLGLKKKQRKAFELSQRSLDCVGELRSYGQNVHVEPQQKSKRIRGKGKPQPKLMGKGRKKLLAFQEVQCCMQSRRKCQRLKPTSAAPQKPAESPVTETLSKPTCTPGSTGAPERGEEEEEEDDYSFLPCSQPDPDQKTDSKKAAKRVKLAMPEEFDKWRSEQISHALLSDSRSLESSKGTDGSASSTTECTERVNEGGLDNEDEWRSLTQNEATDMELCSQVDEMEQYGFWTQRDPVHMDIDTAEPDTTLGGAGAAPNCLSTSVSERATPAVPAQSSINDGLFLKPGLPPVTHKAKPSTAKIYASISRSASLAKEMEKASKHVPTACVAKAKAAHSSPLVLPLPNPARVPPAPQPPPKPFIPPQPPMGSLNQAAKAVPSKLAQPPANQANKAVPHRSILHPSNPFPKSTDPLPNISQASQLRSYNTRPRPAAPVSVPAATMDLPQTLDQSYLTQAVLKWEHRMFDNYKTFGPPDDLHPLPLKKVPTMFSSYPDYFSVLFPLLLLNAFEELATEWHSGSKIELDLKVQGIEYCNRTASASFTASLNSQQDMKQLYPKEEDLVFLWLPENTGAYTSDEPEIHDSLPCVGFVSRSVVYSKGGGQPSTLNLTIQTRGNVSSVSNKPVRCKVIGSLVTTLREFRALCELKLGMMKKAILSRHVAYLTPCQEDQRQRGTPTFYLQESVGDVYNEDQEKAIGYGVAMVKRSQKMPKILLIHGPPGTGKSKTIVGLLYKLLIDDRASTSVSHQGKCSRMRILVCAPSNAAIDNLMKKMIPTFKEKSNCPQGNCGDINLVRLGSEKTISAVLHPFSLDRQTKARTLKAQQASDSDIQRQKEELEQRIENISQQCARTLKKSDEFVQLMAQKSHYLKEREKLGRQLKENRRKRQEVQARLLQEANVICSTLSTSGSVVLESAFRRLGREPFSCVIVDEAGQAKETETLIPFLYRCPSLILVGDPEQLPPTVVSQNAKKLGYDQSLMARLMVSLHPLQSASVFLSMQYRMHPDICEFPSKYIYSKKLKTHCRTAEKRCSLNWPFEPYRVFDVTDGRESRVRESFYNLKEVQLVLLLLSLVREEQVVRVGVITPYNAQKQHILEALKDSRSPSVEVNTVDGFQGRDMDCIIVSCVRAGSKMGSIGFVGNRQRMNVTITRAKFSLFILGHLCTLREQSDWGALIEDAARRGTIIKTQERDFHEATRKVLKRDLLSRNPSYPHTGGLVPARRPSEPSHSRSPTVSSSTGGWSRRASLPPTHADRPRDPRLSSRPSDARLVEAQPIRELDRSRQSLLHPKQPVREPDRDWRRSCPRQPVRDGQSLLDTRQRAHGEAHHHDEDPHVRTDPAHSSPWLSHRKRRR